MKLIIVLAAMSASAASAQHSHTKSHAAKPSMAAPTEAGQDAFAAIGEIVSILRSDPQTDWSKVDIEALRKHLIDMNNVTLRSKQSMRSVPGGAIFTVTGEPDVAQAIRQIASAHFTSENMPGGWSMKSVNRADGAVVTVTGPNAADAAQIRALGFVGLMTLGAHHQPHHLMMAKGIGHH